MICARTVPINLEVTIKIPKRSYIFQKITIVSNILSFKTMVPYVKITCLVFYFLISDETLDLLEYWDPRLLVVELLHTLTESG